MMSRSIIIAEAGVNHNGKIGIAKRLVDASAAAGADFVKFQTFKAVNLATLEAPKAAYQMISSDKNQLQQTMLSNLQLTKSMHFDLLKYCGNKKIGFLSSAFDITSLEFLSTLKLKYFKIPSGEITNLPYLLEVGKYGRPIILSTGMSSLSEIRFALKTLVKAGTPKSKIIVLHCNSEYPTPPEDVNLLAMCDIKKSLKVKVGFSDHSIGIEIPVAAAALGAVVIEKHITLDRDMDGPDHAASLEPDQFSAMVKSIRRIELALGTRKKKISKSEKKNLIVVRKSIVASKNIAKGELFTVQNITAKRPGDGISPVKWASVLGTKAKRNFSKDEKIVL